MIVISGDTQGWIVPCGCTANQSGGLPAAGDVSAATALRRDVLYFDAGGAGAGDSPYQQMKLEAIFAAKLRWGYRRTTSAVPNWRWEQRCAKASLALIPRTFRCFQPTRIWPINTAHGARDPHLPIPRQTAWRDRRGLAAICDRRDCRERSASGDP
jgi:hypothetical protein